MKVDHPVYEALAAISRHELSLTPEVLAGYQPLLDCPEVLRLAGGGPIDQRAKSARAAIVAALDSIHAPDVRKAGRAGLFLDGYDGLKPCQREGRIYEGGKGFTRTMYIKKRRQALKEVVCYLEAPVRVLEYESDGTTVAASTQPMLMRLLQHLGKLAADMHFALLACSFIEYLDVGTTYDYFPSRRAAALAHIDRLLDVFIEYTGTGFYEANEEQLTKYFWRYVPQESLVRLIHYLREITTCMPPIPADTCRKVIVYEIGAPHVDTGVDPRWQLRWDLFNWDSDHYREREVIAAASGCVMYLIAETIGLTAPIIAEARHQAYKTIAYFYDFDDLEPISEGRSIREHATSYFDTESKRLSSQESFALAARARHYV